jgi:hypothetical protein
MAHVGRGQGFHRLGEIATYSLGHEVFETCRCKTFGLAKPKRWISREKRCDVSVVVVGRRPTGER